jgi:hypothetical protein
VVTTLVCFVFFRHARLRVQKAPGIPCALCCQRRERFLQTSGDQRRGNAESHLKLARKDRVPRTMIFFAVAVFPIVPKTLYGAARLCHRQTLDYRSTSKA